MIQIKHGIWKINSQGTLGYTSFPFGAMPDDKTQHPSVAITKFNQSEEVVCIFSYKALYVNSLISKSTAVGWEIIIF